MRVLFIHSNNNGVSPIVSAQAKSLQGLGIDISSFGIIGKGVSGYIKNIVPLRRFIGELSPDIIHAHYSFCGIVAAFAKGPQIICSLMGSDVKTPGLWRIFVKFFVKRIWAATIVKSEDMRQSLGLNCVHVLPNGVDIEVFRPMDKAACRSKLGWEEHKRYVLFAANPARLEKNFKLASESVKKLNRNDVELKVAYNVKHSDMSLYMNASDVLLLTSLWEGSPNVVKEAMACSISIVSTDVGDVKQMLQGVDGCYITQDDPASVAIDLRNALANTEYLQTRKKLMDLHLDSISVAKRLNDLYKTVLENE